ncbi:polymeric immunoglobulin receptor-like isoform X1 [Pleurodeles waltl]|uniref:polymeric immunoglobulin receptor-like isoform X1 n=1 Tax=Pleurodeles waltl TaxID=8319 RepID=UPI003709C1A0
MPLADTMFAFCALALFAVINGAESNPIVAPKQITGLVNGSITIKCYYPTVTKANKYDRKFWCKVTPNYRECYTVVSSSGFLNKDYKERASIRDSPENNYFVIEMSQLKITDAGYFRCGIGLTHGGLYNTVNVAVSDDSIVPEEAELLYGQVRGEVSIYCPYDLQHATERKYLCKLGKTGCKNIIDSTWQVDQDYKGRVMLSYEANLKKFVVHIIHLEKGDAGHYTCGTGKYGEYGDSTDVDLHISEETTIPQVRNMLTAPVGGSIAAECHYDPRIKYSIKYWCKWRDHGCTQLITSDGFVKPNMEGRLALFDNPTNGTLTILMNQLTEGDAGWYWCSFVDYEKEQRFTVQVQITHEQPGLSSTEIVTVAPGNPVRIPCQYPCKYNTYQIYWCKWNSGGCDPMTCTEEHQSGLSISCDKDTREFLLSINSASQHDEGWYWCGVRKDGRYGETVRVHLKVSEEAIPNETPPPAHDNEAPAIGPRSKSGKMPNVDKADEESSPEAESSHVLPIVLSLGAVVLLLAAAYLVFRLRSRRSSDLVSVGSFRTNISLSEMDNSSYTGKENPVGGDLQETEIGQEEPKNPKKGSREDIAYMTCLIDSEKTNP